MFRHGRCGRAHRIPGIFQQPTPARPCLGFEREQLDAQLCQICRRSGGQVVGHVDLAAHAGRRADAGAALERKAPIHRFVQHHAHGIEVARSGGLLGEHLFRCHVARCSGPLGSKGLACGFFSRIADKAKVQDPEVSIVAHDHVGRLDVAVKLAGFMQGTDTLDQLRQGTSEPGFIEGALVGPARLAEFQIAHLPDKAAEVATPQEVHREEPRVRITKELVQGHQVRVGDIRKSSELVLKPVQALGITAGEGFQRDRLPTLLIEGFVDGSHAALAQRAKHAKAAFHEGCLGDQGLGSPCHGLQQRLELAVRLGCVPGPPLALALFCHGRECTRSTAWILPTGGVDRCGITSPAGARSARRHELVLGFTRGGPGPPGSTESRSECWPGWLPCSVDGCPYDAAYPG